LIFMLMTGWTLENRKTLVQGISKLTEGLPWGRLFRALTKGGLHLEIWY
jgi:hypothetical protein